MFDILYIFFICLTAALITGMTGFGYAMVCMAFFTMIYDIKTSVLLTLLSSVVILIQLLYQLLYKSKVHVKIGKLILPVIGTVAGSSLGFYLLELLPETLLIILLCLILIAISVYFAFLTDKIKVKQNKRNGLIAGLMSGTLNGLYNMGGPPLVTYFFASSKDKKEYNTYLQLTLLSGTVFNLIAHFSTGNVTIDILKSVAFSVPACIIGNYLGYRIFERISCKLLGKLISGSIVVLGLLQIIRNASVGF